MNKKVFILLGHPDNDTLNGSLADVYEKGAREVGYDVRRMNIGDLNFDPILHKGYKQIQELEPDLKQVQENIKWSNHFVIFYPIWHGGPPAILKGLFDRVFLPSFAFEFREPQWLGWKKLLKGRTARMVVTSGSFPILAYIMFGDYTNEIRLNLLGFAGFKVKMTGLGPAEKISARKFKRWQEKVSRLGKKGL
jgi:NAD(P)H dehydrogenase (quinone)